MKTIDSKLLARLQQDGRANWAELAKLVGLTPPAVAERVRKLEESGVIRRFTAVIDPVLIGA